MISPFWEVIAILVGIVIALIGGSWKLFSAADNHRRRYREDVITLRAILVTKELTPILVSLSRQFQNTNETDTDLKKALEKTEVANIFRQMLQIARKIFEIEELAKSIFTHCNNCGWDLLLFASIPSIAIIFLYFEVIGIFYYTLIVLFLAVLIKTVFDFIQYRKSVNRFISKDNEVRMIW